MKTIEYDGLTFVRDDKTGYYLNSKIHKRLHRYVWEKYNGEIPDGYDIHHIDRNKSNNDITNLQLIKKDEHMKLHGKMQTEEDKQRKRDNLLQNARPKACEWHKSVKGSKWHREHYENMKDKLHEKKEFECKLCGKVFMSTREGFCSNTCKSAHRRKMGYDNETRKCVYCGEEFIANKYSKATHCSQSCVNKNRAKKQNTP